MKERLGSLNKVCEGVVGVKNHTKKCYWPYAIFALKMSLLFRFDQMVQKKTQSSHFALISRKIGVNNLNFWILGVPITGTFFALTGPS